MIRVENLTKLYEGFEAVRGISFQVERGERLALIGTSGSGKTTILKMLNGLIPRTSGEISIRGKSIDSTNLVSLRRSMGYVIQGVGLFPHYTVAKNLAVTADIQGKTLDLNSVMTLLDRVGVSRQYASSSPDELSGGQQQRIGIARAIANDPDILLMDEPFGALDPITRKENQQEFMRLPGLTEKAVVLVTHDLDEAALLGTRLCLLDKGSIMQRGSLRELLFRPAGAFVRDFMAGRRQALEWRAITLADVFPYLEDNGHGEELASVSSLADIIEHDTKGVISMQQKSRAVNQELLLRTYYDNRSAIIADLGYA